MVNMIETLPPPYPPFQITALEPAFQLYESREIENITRVIFPSLINQRTRKGTPAVQI